MNAKLFINYRRKDTAGYAGRLYDRLIGQFSQDQVFMDTDKIRAGQDFAKVIKSKVGSCDVAIVLIGPIWLNAIDASGKRRLDDAKDSVRMEIVAALRRKIPVIPVLVGGAEMPRKEELPEVLAALSRRQAIELSETHFHADVNRLIQEIQRFLVVAEGKAELSVTPAVAPLDPAALRPPPEAESKPAESKKPKETDAEAIPAAAPVSLGETTEEFPTHPAPPYWESETGQQDSVATAKEPTPPVKSTPTTHIQSATPPITWTSAITALEGTKVWTRKLVIIGSTIGAIVILLLALAGFLTGTHRFRKAVGDTRDIPDYQKRADQGNQPAVATLQVPTATGDQALPQQLLAVNSPLVSGNGQFSLVYQGDGNLVLYRKSDGKALWASKTNGQSVGMCIMQGDGNLVIYDAASKPVFASHTSMFPGSWLVVQSNGNVVIHKPNYDPVWATNTVQTALPTELTATGDQAQPQQMLAVNSPLVSENGQFSLVYQGDGNLVLYRKNDGKALWASKTNGQSVGMCIMQRDGNLVIYDAASKPIFASQTSIPGSRLVVRSDGNVVIYRPNGVPAWETNTVHP
jgi:hypothetical protein